MNSGFLAPIGYGILAQEAEFFIEDLVHEPEVMNMYKSLRSNSEE